jgi:hypothetical protein
MKLDIMFKEIEDKHEPESMVPEFNNLPNFERKPGSSSNSIIRARNRGIKHQFEDDIGGCSANYR